MTSDCVKSTGMIASRISEPEDDWSEQNQRCKQR